MVLPVGSKDRTWRRKYFFHPTGEKDTLQNKAALFVIGYYIVILLLRLDTDRYCDKLLLKYVCFVLHGEMCCDDLGGKILNVIFIYNCSKKIAEDCGGWLRNTRHRIAALTPESRLLQQQRAVGSKWWWKKLPRLSRLMGIFFPANHCVFEYLFVK